MFYLAYLSSAHEKLSQADLAALLATCQRNNDRLGVSGALIYADGTFMQVLEGEEAAVLALYKRIERDPRHHDLIVLDEGHTGEREFGRWSMAFRDMTGQMSAVPAFEELMDAPADSPQSPRLRRLVGSARRQLRAAL